MMGIGDVVNYFLIVILAIVQFLSLNFPNSSWTRSAFFPATVIQTILIVTVFSFIYNFLSMFYGNSILQIPDDQECWPEITVTERRNLFRVAETKDYPRVEELLMSFRHSFTYLYLFMYSSLIVILLVIRRKNDR
uniref:Neur_chan_memb domain-containing protein n=1 Tax=Caenorhabditis tropicalis TaxID=1561998 RepID=A0A1I7UI62_9PELO